VLYGEAGILLGRLAFKFVIDFFNELGEFWASGQQTSARLFVDPSLSWVSQRSSTSWEDKD